MGLMGFFFFAVYVQESSDPLLPMATYSRGKEMHKFILHRPADGRLDKLEGRQELAAEVRKWLSGTATCSALPRGSGMGMAGSDAGRMGRRASEGSGLMRSMSSKWKGLVATGQD